MDVMTTVKSKLLVDSQNSFLFYYFKSLNLVRNIAMNETFIIIAGHLISKKLVSINSKTTLTTVDYSK